MPAIGSSPEAAAAEEEEEEEGEEGEDEEDEEVGEAVDAGAAEELALELEEAGSAESFGTAVSVAAGWMRRYWGLTEASPWRAADAQDCALVGPDIREYI
jgi:hypothetical protein